MGRTSTISLPENLKKYILDTQLNLSRFVQERLKERIIAEGKADKYLKDQKKQ